MLTVAIIASDVVLNAWVGAIHSFQLDAFIAQSLVLVFVLATARIAWPRRSSGLPGGRLLWDFLRSSRNGRRHTLGQDNAVCQIVMPSSANNRHAAKYAP
jgi:hypothetical protein